MKNEIHFLNFMRKNISGFWTVTIKPTNKQTNYITNNKQINKLDIQVLGSVGCELKSLDLTSSTFIGWVPPSLEQVPSSQ